MDVDERHVDPLHDESSGYTGKGVIVAIIDSGIDYTHPALGGGLWEGYKVISGYDFVNDDEDPVDDLRHGTHVAGIVAAGRYQVLSPQLSVRSTPTWMVIFLISLMWLMSVWGVLLEALMIRWSIIPIESNVTKCLRNIYRLGSS